MKLKKVFFDLDGTLTDSMPGITKGVQYALKHYGIQVDDLNVLKPFVGPPLSDSFKEYYNFSEGRRPHGLRGFLLYPAMKRSAA